MCPEFGLLFNETVKAFQRELGLSADADWFDTRQTLTGDAL
jgi:hypothetical protein